jgi:allophanate hydrolase subunit 1
MSAEPRFLPAGGESFIVELGSRDRAAAAYRAVLALVERREHVLGRPRDIVPAATTVLIDGVADVEAWRAAVSAALLDGGPAADAESDADPHLMAVAYDGPDLATVASVWDCSVDEVVARHTAAEFTVAFCGFAPGFAYCTSEPALPAVPRRETPRTRVPAGSVALAAEFCGVYPRDMPGGWQVIGTTSAQMFDARRDPPALLAPGARVRFEAR